MLSTAVHESSVDSHEASRLRWVSLKDTPKLVKLYNLAREGNPETRRSMLSWLEHGGGLALETPSQELVCAIRWREDAKGWTVDRIATLPEARGRGYGRWLMTKVEALAIRKNIPSLTLVLDEVNNELSQYYQRMGYRIIEQTDTTVTLDKRVGGTWQYKA